MTALAATIAARNPSPNQIALYWLAQAGFALKNSASEVIYVDPYFSDVVERVIGFKRMMGCPLSAEEVTAGLVVCTHEHLDHMDTDALPVLAKAPDLHFAGPCDCMGEFEKHGVPPERCHLLEKGRSFDFGAATVHAVYADHGELSRCALGVVLEMDGIRIYHTGDTAFRPEEFRPALGLQPDILLPCINGAFGNMNAEEAAKLTALAAPKVVIPTHFWMFVEQNGDPAGFLKACANLAPDTQALLLKPGEELLFEKSA